MKLLILAAFFVRVATAEVEVDSEVETVAVDQSQEQQSFCHKVIPLKNDSITWYSMMTNITEIEISVVGVMDLYLREGLQKGELEAIFKNVNFTISCYPNICTESVQNDVERMQERMERCILNVHCFENGTFRAWYPKKGSYDKIYEYEFSEVLYWMPFRYDPLKDEALQQNLTIVHKPVLGVNSQFQCIESFNFGYDNEAGYEINSYSNDTSCASYPPGRIFSHTVHELVDKNDYTVQKWNSNFTRTALLALRRTLASAELNGFLSAAEHKRIFENHNIPKSLKSAALDLRQLIRFKDGHDTKMRMRAQVWDWNFEVDLLARTISDPRFMIIRAVPLVSQKNFTTAATTSSTIEDLVPDVDVRSIILKPAISGFNASGVLLFDFLGDIQLKHLAPRHNINLILKSTRLDIDAIERIRQTIEADKDMQDNFTTDFTVPWSEMQGIFPAQHKINCTDSSYCTVDMIVDAEFTLLDVKSKYELFVKHRLNKTDLKIESYAFGARIADEGKFDVKLVDLELEFVEYVPREDTDEEFKLFGETIDNSWFVDETLPTPPTA